MISLCRLALGICLLNSFLPAAQTPNLIRDGDFERSDLQLARTQQAGQWGIFGMTEKDVTLGITLAAGRNPSRCLAYRRTEQSKANIHVDQVVPVRPNTIYELSASVRWEGNLHPILFIARMDWKPLGITVCQEGRQWTQVHMLFDSLDNDQVRVEWFPGAEGKLYTAAPGMSWLTDVSLREVPHPSSALRLAFDVTRPKAADETPASQRHAGPVAAPSPLRRILCRDGVLQYEDGGEVALWGVNLQTALSWEYNGRLKPSGIPLQAAALKQITRDALDELQLMESQIVRVHLLPSDFTDSEGNLVDTVFLDVLDDLISQCSHRGIYVYLTLINDMQVYYRHDSFMTGHDRAGWLFDPAMVAHMETYIKALLNHRNRYTDRAYFEEPAFAVFELINEPGYLSYDQIAGMAADAPPRRAFEKWCAANGGSEFPSTYFATYRYELVRSVMNRLADAVRSTGSHKPLVWNLNWPGMVGQHEDVYQAVADSSVDVVSFCCYPGQRDVPDPYWNHPMDLSDRNYLGYLRDCSTNYQSLCWLLGKRFASKAKVTYEFETFFNQSSYLYPAMARLFRSLGSQMAMMWQYTLPPAARYCSGSHYLNLQTSPQKGLSFQIASRVFTQSPRYAAYDSAASTEMNFDHCALSFPKNASIWSDDHSLLYSRGSDWQPLPMGKALREISGCGTSSVVGYEGTGAYFLRIDGNQIDLRILPDVRYEHPLWQYPGHWPWKPFCSLDTQTPHRFTLRLPGWEGSPQVQNIADPASAAKDMHEGSIDLAPGHYRINKAPAQSRK